MTDGAANRVALLRGINVGGATSLPMAELRVLAEGLGWRGVRSYIASGNLVFAADGEPAVLGDDLAAALLEARGREIAVLVLAADELRAALENCPFKPEEGKHVHAFFLFADPVVDRGQLEALRAPSEVLTVAGRIAWLWAPEGIGRSKLAEKLDKVVTGTDMTGRNLNTIKALVAMLG